MKSFWRVRGKSRSFLLHVGIEPVTPVIQVQHIHNRQNTHSRQQSRATPKRHYDEWIIIASPWWRLLIVETVSIIYGCRSNTKTPNLRAAALSETKPIENEAGPLKERRAETWQRARMKITCLSAKLSLGRREFRIKETYRSSGSGWMHDSQTGSHI